MWPTQRLTPDFKTIANFCKNNGQAIHNVCRQFVVLCRQLDLFSDALVAIDGLVATKCGDACGMLALQQIPCIGCTEYRATKK
jgi:hypothetical protein